MLGITLHPVFVSSVERGEENVSIAGARGVDLAASLGRIVIALLRAYLPLAGGQPDWAGQRDGRGTD